MTRGCRQQDDVESLERSSVLVSNQDLLSVVAIKFVKHQAEKRLVIPLRARGSEKCFKVAVMTFVDAVGCTYA